MSPVKNGTCIKTKQNKSPHGYSAILGTVDCTHTHTEYISIRAAEIAPSFA